MSDSKDRKQTYGNPVGDEAPLVRFDVPLWQVFVALLLIACVLTAFKVYERNRIAPNKVVQWKPFSLTEFRNERLNRRTVLVWVRSTNEELNRKVTDAFEATESRTSVYMRRCLVYEISAAGDRDDEVREWLSKNAAALAQGGIGLWIASSKKPETLILATVNPDSIVKLIEGG